MLLRSVFATSFLVASTLVASIGCGTSSSNALVCDNGPVGSDKAPIGKEGESALPSGSAGGDAGATSSRPSDPAAAIAAEVGRIAASVKSGHYTHQTFVDEATGQYDFDCSSFVAYVLDRAAPDHLAPFLATGPRPLARDYAVFMANLAPEDSAHRWRRVKRSLDLVPGDLIAWTLDASRNHGDTGHVMFVAGTPSVNPERSDEVIVPVADATWHAHGTRDPRGAEHRSGVGVGGAIGLIGDPNGFPTAYRWNASCGPDQSSPTIGMAHPLAIAR